MTPTILWALLLVTAIAVIGTVKARSMTASRAKAETLRVLAESVRGLSLACRLDGHVYREVDTGYQCANCSGQVDRMEGARYVFNEARRGGDVAAIVKPDQVPLSESGMSTEHPPRTS
jgi:hypothetical protein